MKKENKNEDVDKNGGVLEGKRWENLIYCWL